MIVAVDRLRNDMCNTRPGEHDAVNKSEILLLLLLLYTDVYTGQSQAPKCGLIGGPVSKNKINNNYI